jgi:hypothetical protein
MWNEFLKRKNLQRSHHYELLKIESTSLINFSFDDVFIFNFYVDITLTYFLNPYIFILLCNNCSVVIPKNLWWFSLMFLTTWIIKKLTMLILNVVLSFTFVYNPKNYKCDSPNCPPIHAFTLKLLPERPKFPKETYSYVSNLLTIIVIS